MESFGTIGRECRRSVIDEAVLRIERSYEVRGMVKAITSYDATGSPLPSGEGPGVRASQIILQFDGSGSGDLAAADLSHRYLWGPTVDQILADEQVETAGTAGEVLWPLTDHLNTVRDLAEYDDGATTIANHRVYHAFGEIVHETEPALKHLFAFTARPFDPHTGLQNNVNRWYDAAVGRWLSEDPIGFGGEDANLCRYIGNAPLAATDPLGLEVEDLYNWSFGDYSPVEDLYNWSLGDTSPLELRGEVVTRHCSILILAGHTDEVEVMLETLYGFYRDRFGAWNKLSVVSCASARVHKQIAQRLGEGALVGSLLPRQREHHFILWFQFAARSLEAAFRDAQKAAQRMCRQEPPDCVCDEVGISIECSPDMATLVETGELRGRRFPVTPFQRELCTLLEERTDGPYKNRFLCNE